MASKQGAKQQRKKKNSVGGASTISQSSIPVVDKPIQEVSIDDCIKREELEALMIREEELAKLYLRKSRSAESSRPSRKVLVRRPVGDQYPLSSNRRNVAILRPLPRQLQPSQTKILGSRNAGPRFTESEGLVPHSVLGTADDYIKSHKSRSTEETLPEGFSHSPSIFMPTRASQQTNHDKTPPSTHENALLEWKRSMSDRKNMQDKLARAVQTAPESLLMHYGDTYRSKQEDRAVIDSRIPAVEAGKGFFVGSEFWRSQERIGNDLTGIRTTLTASERGVYPELEHMGTSHSIQGEMGIPLPRAKDWERSQYLISRKQKFKVEQQPSMSRLNVTGLGPSPPHSPTLDSEGSEQYASSDELEPDSLLSPISVLELQPDVVDLPIIGPALKVAGHLCAWNEEEGGQDESRPAPVVNTRVLLEAGVQQLTTSYLQLENCSTVAVQYSWKPVKRANPLGVIQAGNTQRFYFDVKGGAILPGQVVSVPFLFKSSKAGVFTEQWQLTTQPVIYSQSGRPVLVTLRGVATQDDLNKTKRHEIDMMLDHKMAESAARYIVDKLVTAVSTPPRSHSPLPTVISEEAAFLQQNPQVYYHHKVVQRLKDLYVETLQPAPSEDEVGGAPEATGSVKKGEEKDKKGGKKKEDKKEKSKEEPDKNTAAGAPPVVVDIPPWDMSLATLQQLILNIDNDDNREEKLKTLNSEVSALSLPSHKPRPMSNFTNSYMLLCEAMDQLAASAVHLRHVMGLPQQDPSSEETGASTAPEAESQARPISQAQSPGGKKEKKGGKGKDSKASTKKETALAKKKSLKAAPPAELPDSKEVTGTPTPLVVADPVLEKKYRENLHTTVYEILGSVVEKMVGLIEAQR